MKCKACNKEITELPEFCSECELEATRLMLEEFKGVRQQYDVLESFFDSVTCLFVEGVEFMSKIEIYEATKRDWNKAVIKIRDLKGE